MNRQSIRLFAVLVLSLLSSALAAQTFPSRQLTLIVPFGAGSGTDTTARVYSRALEEELKQTVIVENRPGAAGTIGVDVVAKSVPDGHTMLFLGGGSISRTFRKQLPAEMLTDLAPVIQLTKGSLFLIVKGDLPVRTGQDFLDFIRKNPGKHHYASIASTQMMLMEVLKDRTKIQIDNITYKDGGQLIQGLLRGDVIAIAGSTVGLEAQFDAGKLRMIAYLDGERNPFHPTVPSAPEAGLSDVRGPFTQAVWVAAKTPSAVISTLNAAFNRTLRRPDIRDLHAKQGGIITGGAPQVQFDAIKAEHAYWAEAARIAKFEPE